MIYSASRRTDLPAFYPDHICGRIRRSRKLEAVVYWTKDPRNFVQHRELSLALGSFPSIIQFTCTGLGGGVWEPRVPAPGELAEALAALARRLPSGALRWRYDPVIFDGDEQERFFRVEALLRGCGVDTGRVILSFPDPYRKVLRRTADAGLSLKIPDLNAQRRFLECLLRRYDGIVELCCESPELYGPRVTGARCVDAALFDRLYHTDLGKIGRDVHQRPGCACSLSTDIGDYSLKCGHGCLYCYANPE